jgi:hypothetical protein
MGSASDVANEQQGIEISEVENARSSPDETTGDHKESGSTAWDWFVKFFSYGGVIVILALIGAIAIVILQWLGK